MVKPMRRGNFLNGKGREPLIFGVPEFVGEPLTGHNLGVISQELPVPTEVVVGQHRFGIPFWLAGEFTTHFRT